MGRAFRLGELSDILGAYALADGEVRSAGHEVLTQVSYRLAEPESVSASVPQALVIQIRITAGEDPGTGEEQGR